MCIHSLTHCQLPLVYTNASADSHNSNNSFWLMLYCSYLSFSNCPPVDVQHIYCLVIFMVIASSSIVILLFFTPSCWYSTHLKKKDTKNPKTKNLVVSPALPIYHRIPICLFNPNCSWVSDSCILRARNISLFLQPV